MTIGSYQVEQILVHPICLRINAIALVTHAGS